MSDRQKKREKFQAEPRKGGKKLFSIVLLALIALSAVAWILIGGTPSGGIQNVSAAEDGVIRLDEADFADGKARFFRFSATNGPIEFFVVKSHDGVIRAAFDACDVCYKEKKGYHQEGNQMICNNCGQAFKTELVNQVKGGCNPAPLERQLVGDQVVIRVAALEQGGRYF